MNVAVISLAAKSNGSSIEQTLKFDSLLTYCNNHGMFNGSIAIIKNGTVIFNKSYGTINKISNKEIDSETLFYIASVSKQFTAMGIMILQERGLLNYDDLVVKYITNIKSLNQNMTIRHLLNHTSGISDRSYYQLQNPTNQDVLEALKLLKPNDFRKPHQNFAYSNTGYVLLASIIENVAKKSIKEFYQDEIFNPLHMSRTTTTKKIFKMDNNKVKPYNIIGKVATYESSAIGPAGIYSTINDLIKWNSELNHPTLVSSKTLELAFTRGQIEKGKISFDIAKKEYGYGFGWMLTTEGNSKIVRHDGSTDGYRSLIRKDISNNIDVILLNNHGGSLAMNEIIHGLNQILENTNYQTPKVPISNWIVNELMTNTMDSVIKNLKTRFSKEGLPDERILGRLGYTYLNQKMIHEAIGLFELNLQLHPESIDANYVLAEAYIENQQFKKAKKAYSKYLLLKPNSEFAIKRLQLIESKLEKFN